ncbi:hypothetical protein C7B79_25840, partial [Chroococcidiopsis cubana CCALA 043]
MSFNLESASEKAATINNFIKFASNGEDSLNDKEQEILRLLCDGRKLTDVSEQDNGINYDYARQLATQVYKKLRKALRKKGLKIKVNKGTISTVVAECYKLMYADSVTTSVEQNGTSTHHVVADLATAAVEQNGNSARKVAKQNVILTYRAIVLLCGRLIEDSNKIECGVSRRVREITAEFKKKYSLEADLGISPREQGDVEITLEGSLEDLERLKELFRANELKDILSIPINDVQISNKNLDGENKKHELVQSIYCQADGYLQLASADLSETALRNANLSYANLSYANLSYANLSYANLSYANLSCADLFRATLIGVRLHQTDLRRADLRQANLSNINLRVARIDRTTKLSKNEHQFNTIKILLEIVGILLELFIKQKVEDKDPPSGNNGSAANIINVNGSGTIIINVNGSGANLSGTNLSGANIINTNFSYANLTGADLSNANIINANFRGTDLRHVNVQYARFRSCKGLYKNTRRSLKQQGAIFEVNPAWQLIGQVVGVIRNLSRWIVSEDVAVAISRFIAIAFIAFV